MGIVRYDPFRDLRTLQEEVNRLFSTNMTRAFRDEGIGRGAWAPSVDIYENKDQIVLEAELPGMKQADFDLTIENNVITLRGERRFEKTDESDNYHRVERSYGTFTRSFTLPQTGFGLTRLRQNTTMVFCVLLCQNEKRQSPGGSKSPAIVVLPLRRSRQKLKARKRRLPAAVKF
jgi:HSP20 family protein